jgi:hypothetical protein
MTTLNDHRPPAEVCRSHGWTPGTRLVGDEGQGPEVIEITAVGERDVLAKTVMFKGHVPTWAREGSWTLAYRDWVEVVA